MPSAPTRPTATYQTLRRFSRVDGDELVVQVATIDGVSFVDLRMFNRGYPGNEHITLRRLELPFFIDVLLRRATAMVGAPPINPAGPTERETAMRDRLAAELRTTIASLRPELEAAIARGDAAAVLAVLGDLPVLMGTPAE